MQIRHMAVAGFSSFINFQITPPQTVSLAQMTQEPLVKVQMDSGETPLQHQSQHYKNPEIAEVFTSKPGRPQVGYQTPLQESQIITAMCLHMKSHFLLSLFQVHPGVVHVVEVF